MVQTTSGARTYVNDDAGQRVLGEWLARVVTTQLQLVGDVHATFKLLRVAAIILEPFEVNDGQRGRCGDRRRVEGSGVLVTGLAVHGLFPLHDLAPLERLHHGSQGASCHRDRQWDRVEGSFLCRPTTLTQTSATAVTGVEVCVTYFRSHR